MSTICSRKQAYGTLAPHLNPFGQSTHLTKKKSKSSSTKFQHFLVKPPICKPKRKQNDVNKIHTVLGVDWSAIISEEWSARRRSIHGPQPRSRPLSCGSCGGSHRRRTGGRRSSPPLPTP
ncbi:unnamed protein product [Musa acuminata var. zebrina]